MTKRNLVKRLKLETEAALKYSQSAVRFAQDGKMSKAMNMLDIAKCAVICANDVHEQLWDVSKGNLTDKEFEIFCESETVSTVFKNAVKTVKDAR